MSWKLLRTCLCLSALALAQRGNAAALTNEEKGAELRQLAALMKAQYGPLDYKREKLKLDLDGLVARYAKESEPLSNLDFYYLLNRFVAEFQDSHFKSRLKTNHVSQLGFILDRIEGKALIDTIDRRALPTILFPFAPGDELLAIDGRPVAEVVADLARYSGHGATETALRMATQLVSYRAAALVPPKFGKSVVRIKHIPDGDADDKPAELEVELAWRQSGEALEEGPSPWAPDSGSRTADYLNIGIDDVYADMPKLEKDYRCSPLTRIAPPAGSKLILLKPFVAYTYPTPKGDVGYLRIPHYMWRTDETLRLKQYEFAVSELEKKTVGLVIDQDHNCGGSVKFLEAMLTLFATEDFDGLPFQFLASRHEYLQFKDFASAEEKATTLEGVSFMKLLDFIKDAWKKGDSRLTPKTTFTAGEKLKPNRVHYTKPILMLIDEMSGSGGDAFPAMMQGMKRAKLFGTRTMGAGGHVVSVSAGLSISGNDLSLTKSLFYRPSGVAIENNGAEPDIKYTPTREDFLKGYRPYQKAYTAALLQMIP